MQIYGTIAFMLKMCPMYNNKLKKLRNSAFILIAMVLCFQSCFKRQISDEGSDRLSTEIIDKPNMQEIVPTEYQQVLAELVSFYPKDSASLYSFFTRIYDKESVGSQIQRIKDLRSDDVSNKYNLVDQRLRGLLYRVVSNRKMTCAQADSIAKIYSFYDEFRGSAMFSQVFKGEDNYNLVRTSFQIMAKESEIDTCYISSLIYLEDHIRTHAELAQTMPSFIVEAIKNNVEGYLAMYNARSSEKKYNFSSHISVYDQPDSTLTDRLTNISTNSKSDDYKIAATEILQNLDKMYNQ
jgi:hypothetical protein